MSKDWTGWAKILSKDWTKAKIWSQDWKKAKIENFNLCWAKNQKSGENRHRARVWALRGSWNFHELKKSLIILALFSRKGGDVTPHNFQVRALFSGKMSKNEKWFDKGFKFRQPPTLQRTESLTNDAEYGNKSAYNVRLNPKRSASTLKECLQLTDTWNSWLAHLAMKKRSHMCSNWVP